MRYLKEKVVNRIEISKSVFIAVLYPIETKENIEEMILLAKKDYPNANHYCSGAIYGDLGEFAWMDDDGEPQRSAGLPILEVLKHHDVTNILCVVIRYFGGIKLGGGGLIRAYTKACADAITFANLYTKQLASCYEITFGYHLQSHIDQFIDKAGSIQKKSYAENVTYIITIEDSSYRIDQISHLLDACTKLDDCTIYTSVTNYK